MNHVNRLTYYNTLSKATRWPYTKKLSPNIPSYRAITASINVGAPKKNRNVTHYKIFGAVS